MIAAYFHLIGAELGHAAGVKQALPEPAPMKAPSAASAPDLPALADTMRLSPRLRQTLQRLLLGDSEKEIAAHLGVSRHTVHVYVKSLYRRFGVSSRGELLARFVQPHTPPPILSNLIK
jgi:DNA-binding CsgD family transcriptional regulator